MPVGVIVDFGGCLNSGSPVPDAIDWVRCSPGREHASQSEPSCSMLAFRFLGNLGLTATESAVQTCVPYPECPLIADRGRLSAYDELHRPLRFVLCPPRRPGSCRENRARGGGGGSPRGFRSALEALGLSERI